MALQQHFGNTGSGTEVGINLEGRAYREEVRIDALGDDIVQVFLCFFSLMQTGVLADCPSGTPTDVSLAMLDAVCLLYTS